MGNVPDALNAKQLEANIWAIDRRPLTDELRAWSADLPGFLWIGQDHVTHSVGSKATYFLCKDTAIDQMAHRYRVQTWIGKECGPSYGSQARAILRHLDWHYDGYDPGALREMLDPWHFQHCKPRSTIPYCRLYDLKSAYWQVIKRMPSPLAVPGRAGHVQFVKIDPKSARKWEALSEFLETGEKAFRLRFVGVCASGAGAALSSCWRLGEETRIPIRRITALAGMSALAIRVTYEACQMQAQESKSRYANVDAVVIEGENVPAVWDSLGLVYSMKAEGPGDLRAVGAWKVGDKCSESYTRRPILPSGDRWNQKFDGIILPAVYHSWLKPKTRDWLSLIA